MKTIQDYLNHADECERLVRNTRSPDKRRMIAEMAETWRMLAEQRRLQLEKEREKPPNPNQDIAWKRPDSGPSLS